MKLPLELYNKGTILWVNFPFEDSDKLKRRPAVVVNIKEDKMMVMVLKVTSHKIRNIVYDYKIQILDNTGLVEASVVRCNKVYFLTNKDEYEYCGYLSDKDLEEVLIRLNKAVKEKKIVLHNQI